MQAKPELYVAVTVARAASRARACVRRTAARGGWRGRARASASVALAAGFTAFVLSGTAPARAADADDVTVRTTHVAGAVYMLEGRGGNIGVSAGDDGILLVDDQFAPLAPKIRAAVAKLADGPLRFVLNTHFHGDHVGGNPVFGEEALIVAHENVRERLATPQDMFGRTREPLPPEGWPVVTFDRSVTVHFNGEAVRVIHLPPGHTDGDAIVWFTKSNVLHMGDLLFAGRFPFVDLDHGGSLEGYVADLDSVLALGLPEDIRVIPGHGPLSGLDAVRALRDMIRETTAIVRARIEAGQSLDAIRAAGLPSRFDAWNWEFISTERWIDTIWRAITGRRPE